MSLDQAFAQIQRHEAAIAEAQLLASRPGLQRDEARDLADGAQREAAALCRIAREAGDRDALTRCADAERTAQSIAARAAVNER